MTRVWGPPPFAVTAELPERVEPETVSDYLLISLCFRPQFPSQLQEPAVRNNPTTCSVYMILK